MQLSSPTARCAGPSVVARMRWAVLRTYKAFIIARLQQADPRLLRSVHLANLPLTGDAPAEAVSLFAWAWPLWHPSQVRVEIAAPKGARIAFHFPLAKAVRNPWPTEPPPIPTRLLGQTGVDPRADERTTRFRINGLTWTYLGGTQTPPAAWELTRVSNTGFQWTLRDTLRFCYVTQCECNTTRYAEPRGIALVVGCWPCTLQARARRKALAQYDHRADRTGREKPQRRRRTKIA